MGWWQINADTLASGRFVISPLAETIAALMLLDKGAGAHPGEQAWLDAHLPGYRRLLAGDEIAALLVPAAIGRHNWHADFLTPTPSGADGVTFEQEVAAIRRTSAEAARADLRVSLRGPLPAPLERSDLPDRLAAVLEWVWRETVLPTWPRRRTILESDVVSRTRRLTQGGWAAALGELRPGMRWLGESRLQINTFDYPPMRISGTDLMFVPVTPYKGWVTAEEPHRYAVIYPCSGALAETDRTPAPRSLGRLLGAGRATVLMLLDTPKSTTQLVALTGQPLGSVGRHLKILLDAGLAERRRAGRSVLYYQTDAATVLIRAQRQPAD
ncbi:helix-turn-helix transcriptional regulator [Nonomuraea sp. NN258]|uniref:ArsR family transcriptional regulator n=1 Tax=Nonomuraea antri TaxID=2730852 RepID=UPI001569055B|nr:ArsR family transcriptional regulator [Nonomuraea antri]NRQ38636.1 helix-turn-helix transcriptional regulator [Nonomuraea antri]